MQIWQEIYAEEYFLQSDEKCADMGWSKDCKSALKFKKKKSY